MEAFDKILLSPGPGIPDEAGLLKEIIARYASTKEHPGDMPGANRPSPRCLGVPWSILIRCITVSATTIEQVVEDEILYENLSKEMEVGRYHSWVVSRDLPESLEVTSRDAKRRDHVPQTSRV